MLFKKKNIVIICCILFFVSFISQARADATFVILRHGEKNHPAKGQISCKGLNRALALPDLLLKKYGKPERIYAPNPSVMLTEGEGAYPYMRPLATIEPLAIRIGEPVNVSWGLFDVEGVVSSLLLYPKGTYIIAWEHKMGERIAKRLMSEYGGSANTVPTWARDDFDSLYVIRLTTDPKTNKNTIVFTKEQQNLEGLSDTCPSALVQK
jgi:hypothetical protein